MLPCVADEPYAFAPFSSCKPTMGENAEATVGHQRDAQAHCLRGDSGIQRPDGRPAAPSSLAPRPQPP